MIFVSVLAIVPLNWIRGAVRTSATIEWNMQKEKPVSKIWNTSSETSYFTGANTLKPYKSCDAVWCNLFIFWRREWFHQFRLAMFSDPQWKKESEAREWIE